MSTPTSSLSARLLSPRENVPLLIKKVIHNASDGATSGSEHSNGSSPLKSGYITQKSEGGKLVDSLMVR